MAPNLISKVTCLNTNCEAVLWKEEHGESHTNTHIYKSSSLYPSLWHFGLFYEVRNGKPSKRFCSHTDVTHTLFSAVNFHSSTFKHRKRLRNRFTVVQALETSVEVCVWDVILFCLMCSSTFLWEGFKLTRKNKKIPVFNLKKSHFGLFNKRWKGMDPI